ncbi:winged helix-turn-helix domain-containing protein [Streptomyces sp. H39-C1]|uniref:winged helix-turn-helix domain-containing protein n=1 Tax=Streptomyces sp. H39-C1 TaxID=3004355 RepID=UPI0022AFBE8A|nr:winged helix-turn-helix domain-containing protein [Streptomyces sp. H39-C1]MCZ4099796.1 winged helix-turn-helix domain-containing protein [Streptomyces sp. H39-C1]
MLLTFEVIAESLRERIRSGGLKPGDALSTQAVLMAEFGASSLSVQKAMALLKRDGYAISRPGKGTFVAQPDIDIDTDEDPGSSDVGSVPVGGTAARVEALELALAQTVEQLTGLRARVEALEAGFTR